MRRASKSSQGVVGGVACLTAAAVVLPMLSGGSAALGAVPKHFGTADPLTEGYSVLTDLGATGSPHANDNGSGVDSWGVAKTNPFQQLGYQYELTPADMAAINTQGWLVRTKLRVAGMADDPDYAISVLFSAGNRRFDMALGSEADGDPMVTLVDSFVGDGLAPTGTTFTLQGGGSGYHTFELCSINGTVADLYVDGLLRLSGYQGTDFVQATPQ